LFGHFHTPYFRGDVRPDFPGQNQRENGGGEFQDQGIAGSQTNQVHREKGIHQVIGQLDGQDTSDEEGYNHHNPYGIDPQSLNFMKELPNEHFELFRSGKGLSEHPEVSSDMKKPIHLL